MTIDWHEVLGKHICLLFTHFPPVITTGDLQYNITNRKLTVRPLYLDFNNFACISLPPCFLPSCHAVCSRTFYHMCTSCDHHHSFKIQNSFITQKNKTKPPKSLMPSLCNQTFSPLLTSGNQIVIKMES